MVPRAWGGWRMGNGKILVKVYEFQLYEREKFHRSIKQYWSPMEIMVTISELLKQYLNVFTERHTGEGMVCN